MGVASSGRESCSSLPGGTGGGPSRIQASFDRSEPQRQHQERGGGEERWQASGASESAVHAGRLRQGEVRCQSAGVSGRGGAGAGVADGGAGCQRDTLENEGE